MVFLMNFFIYSIFSSVNNTTVQNEKSITRQTSVIDNIKNYVCSELNDDKFDENMDSKYNIFEENGGCKDIISLQTLNKDHEKVSINPSTEISHTFESQLEHKAPICDEKIEADKINTTNIIKPIPINYNKYHNNKEKSKGCSCGCFDPCKRKFDNFINWCNLAINCHQKVERRKSEKNNSRCCSFSSGCEYIH